MFRWNFPCSGLYSLPLVLSLGTTGNKMVPSSCHLPLKRLQDLHSVFSSLKSLKFLSLSSEEWYFCPIIIFVILYCTLSSSSMCLVNWGAQNWIKYSKWGFTRQRGRKIFLHLLATLLMLPGWLFFNNIVTVLPFLCVCLCVRNWNYLKAYSWKLLGLYVQWRRNIVLDGVAVDCF